MPAGDRAGGCRGGFVAVVGPSGAGKDTLLAGARRRLADDPGFHFARRIVTRPPDPDLEDHDSLDREAFLAAHRAGAFCLTWEAHGLLYGLPDELTGIYLAGGTIVANVSRAALPAIQARFTRLHVIEITASTAVLRRRLLSRGRESPEEVERRLARSAPRAAIDAAHTCESIDNSSDRATAESAFMAALRRCAAAAANDGGGPASGGRAPSSTACEA